MKLERILVPVDPIDPPYAAIEEAARLAEESGAMLDILHVWEGPSWLGSLAMVSVSAKSSPLWSAFERAGRALQDVIDDTGVRGRVRFVGELEIGTPWKTICDVAESGHYDLIVLGTHRRTGLRRLLLGSVTDQVVRHAPCPVLTVSW